MVVGKLIAEMEAEDSDKYVCLESPHPGSESWVCSVGPGRFNNDDKVGLSWDVTAEGDTAVGAAVLCYVAWGHRKAKRGAVEERE